MKHGVTETRSWHGGCLRGPSVTPWFNFNRFVKGSRTSCLRWPRLCPWNHLLRIRLQKRNRFLPRCLGRLAVSAALAGLLAEEAMAGALVEVRSVALAQLFHLFLG